MNFILYNFIFNYYLTSLKMNSLFEGFSKKNIYTTKPQIEECLKELVETKIYPSVVKFIQNKIDESLTKGHKIRYIQTRINHKNPNGIFQISDIPQTIELNGKKYNVPIKLIIKYRNMIIDMFISEYNKLEGELITFESNYMDRYYYNKTRKRIISCDEFNNLTSTAQKYYNFVEDEIYLFKFYLEPKKE